MTPRDIAASLRAADRKALCSRPGSGAFTGASWKRLMDLGLMDMDFYPTSLGYEVRAILDVRDVQ